MSRAPRAHSCINTNGNTLIHRWLRLHSESESAWLASFTATPTPRARLSGAFTRSLSPSCSGRRGCYARLCQTRARDMAKQPARLDHSKLDGQWARVSATGGSDWVKRWTLIPPGAKTISIEAAGFRRSFNLAAVQCD